MSKSPIEKELDALRRNENSFIKKRLERKERSLENLLSDKMPAKLEASLDSAFTKAFHVIFSKGTGLIEKTWHRRKSAEHYEKDRAMLDEKGRRRDIRRFRNRALGTGTFHTLASAAAGTFMGLIGVGIPDVAVFTVLMLRNIYKIASGYGYGYTDDDEKKFILRIIAASLKYGEDLKAADRKINVLAEHGIRLDDSTLEERIEEAALSLSRDLVYMKFVQGIPVVGVIGGASDFIYMEKISDYAELKYRRRFLYDRKNNN